jgi:hypothetical protein
MSQERLKHHRSPNGGLIPGLPEPVSQASDVVAVGPLSHAWSFFELSPLMIDVAAGMRRFCTVASNGF